MQKRERGARTTNAEGAELEKWEKSVINPDKPALTDLFLAQNLIPMAQPLKSDETVLFPHDVRVSPCGYFIQWRGRRVVDNNLRLIAFKGRHSIERSLREFILLSGEPRETDVAEAGKVEKDIVLGV